MMLQNNKLKLHTSNSEDSFESISNQHMLMNNLVNAGSKHQRATSFTESRRMKPNEGGDNDDNESHEELFDPSLMFVSVHNCYFWDNYDRVRKGKIFLTKTELLFKCSRMPFVRVRLKLCDIEDIVKIKNYKNQYQSVLSVQCSNSRTFVFYKFRLPKTLIKNTMLTLVRDARKMNNDLSECEEENLNSYKLRLRKLGKSVTDLKNIIRTPKINQKSKSNSTLAENEQVEALRNENYLKKSLSSNYLDNQQSTVVFRNRASMSGSIPSDPQQQVPPDEYQQSAKSASFKKRTMRRIKSSSKDLSNDSNFSPDLDTENEKRKGIFIKNNKAKQSPRPSSITSLTKEPEIEEQEETYPPTTKNIITINNSNSSDNSRESIPSVSITSFGSSVQFMEINQFNTDKHRDLSRESSTKSHDSSRSESYEDVYSNRPSKFSSGSFKNTSFTSEDLISVNSNAPQLNFRSNFLIVFFLIAILIYSFMTIVNFIKLCLLEASIKFDL